MLCENENNIRRCFCDAPTNIIKCPEIYKNKNRPCLCCYCYCCRCCKPPKPEPEPEPEPAVSVGTPEELNAIRFNLSGNYVLSDNIDLTEFISPGGEGFNGGLHWEPIGSRDNPFTGKFDGKCHKITGLQTNRLFYDNVGLFGRIENSEIKNLIVETSGTGVRLNYYGGILVGSCRNSNITNCHTDGVISGRYVGGLAGYLDIGNHILDCGSSGEINATLTGGGFAGYCYTNNKIERCHSRSNVLNTGYDSGGFTGYIHSESKILNCYALGNIWGNQFTGGFMGASGSISNDISKCYSAGSVYGVNIFVGGFAGVNGEGTTRNCFYDIETSGQLKGAGAGYGDFESGIFGRTTKEMKTESTFTSHGWDFVNIWDMKRHVTYPFLRHKFVCAG